MIDLDNLIVKNDNVITADMDGDIVMLDIESGSYFNLGATGSVIWNMLDKSITVGVLIDNLIQKYDIDKETCTKETFEFLEKLAEKYIISIEDNTL